MTASNFDSRGRRIMNSPLSRRIRRLRHDFALIGAIALFAAGAPAAEIYKSKDAQGRTVYSDRRLSESDERIDLRTEPSDPEAAQARAASEMAELQRADAKRKQAAAAKQAA